MLSRRSFLGVAACVGVLDSSRTDASDVVLRRSLTDGNSLGELAAGRGIIYGSATSMYELGAPDFVANIVREARMLVPEYELKRDLVEPVQGRYDFTASEALYAFALNHSMTFRGTPLVWHKANPDWLESVVRSTRGRDLLVGYVETIARHFRGRIHSWDVVNEALFPEAGRPDGLRRSFWLDAYGPSYIDMAFHAARGADPRALLIYNDWGCEAGMPVNDLFRARTLDFLEKALARKVPIGGLGIQGHLAAYGPQVDQRKLRTFLDRVASMGLRILVTEHDVDDSGGPSDIAVRDGAVADASRRFLDVVLDNRATIVVLTWGLSDRFLDPPGGRAHLAGYSPRMLPLDTNMRRKPMWQAMEAVFSQE